VLSRGVQTHAASCDNRYSRRADVSVEPLALAGPLSGITSKIGVSRCEQPHVVRQ
jgi:hypothetical protein